MKKLAIILAALIALSSFAAVSAESAGKTVQFLYVSPDGSDEAAGTKAAPFKTIGKAVSAAREIDSTVVVNLRGGKYNISEPIKLTAADKNLVIRGLPGENAVITAGHTIPYSAFKTVTDASFLNKLSDSSAKGKIMSVNLNDLGISDFGEIRIQGMGAKDDGYAPTLSYNDRPLTIARYPNDSYLETETVVFDGKSGDLYYSALGRGEFTTADKRYNSWNKDGIWVFGYFQYDWADVTAPCDFNSANDTLYTYVNPRYGVNTARRFYFFNIPEEIDMPGEWYLDRTSGVLYLYPAADMKTGDELLFSSSENNLFNIENTSGISIENLKLEGTCGYGVNIASSDDVNIYCCEFSSIGKAAVNAGKSSNSGVDCCYFHDIGSYGVRFLNCGDKAALTPSGCYVKNSEFERFQNYRRTYASAIQIDETVGAYAAHNKIHDAPHFAVSYVANDTVFEYNDIYDVCKETRDCGAVYTGRRWDTWGNIFRYNYVHDMKIDSSSKTDFGVHGIYLDDMSAETAVYGNVFANLPSVALIGGGRNNQFVNNLEIDCNAGITYDQRAANTPSESASYEYEGKVYSWDVTQCFTLLKSSYYLSDVWKAKYTGNSQWPKSAQQYMLEDDPEIPKYAVIDRNVTYKTGDRKIADKVTEYGDVKDDFKIASISALFTTYYFKDYDNKDYTLTTKGLSKIRETFSDFEDIPFKKMGQAAYVYENNYVSEAAITSSAVTQGTYTEFQKDGQTAVSKHSIYAYAKFSVGSEDISECGYTIENENGVSITCPALAVPEGSTYAVKFVGAGLTPGTYRLCPYIITADSKTVTGEAKTITLEPKILVGTEDAGNTKVTTYEIEAFK